MPLLFSYGTLRDGSVQRSTFGRAVHGEPDQLVGYERGTITIDDPDFVTEGRSEEHAIIRFTGLEHDRIEGVALEVTEGELSAADAYEPEGYERVSVVLRSGRRAFVYVASGRGPAGEEP